ncbi:hypothetical protein AB1N83_014248 [Pleurotus pulmonarius]
MPETANRAPVGTANSNQQEGRDEPPPKRPRTGRGRNLEEGEVEERASTPTRDDIDMDRNAGDRGDQGPPPPPPPPPPPVSPPPLPPAYLENPHMQFSRRDLAPLLPTESRIAYTQGYFPRVVKSLDALLAGIDEITAEAIKTQPDKFIALLVYGGGDKIKEENPNLMKDIQTFLQGLAIEGSEKLRVIDPPKKDGSNRGAYAKPHILLLQYGSPGLRAFILWFQTFAFQIEGRKIAFSAVRFDISVRPWFITDITGQFVDDDPHMMNIATEVIKQHLSKDTGFRNHVDGCLAKIEKPRSINDRVRDALSTFEIWSMHITDKAKQERVVWQLFAKPIAGDGAEYTEWLRIIKSQRYFIDTAVEIKLAKLKSTKPYDSCAFCKCETHASEDCPYPKVADWKGPIPKEVMAARENDNAGTTMRGGTRGRGTRGRGGRGNGRGFRGAAVNTRRPRPY